MVSLRTAAIGLLRARHIDLYIYMHIYVYKYIGFHIHRYGFEYRNKFNKSR